MSKINPDFAAEIKKYGAKDFDLCYNCGNCSAVCELTAKDANFPRILIRQGLLGQTDEILKSKELWLCYSCGDCTSNCPRQAAPGDFMAALRRFAIASYEPTGLTKLIFKNNIFSILFTLILATVLSFFLLTLKTDNEVARWIFKYISYDIIHNLGILVFIITGISMVWGLVKMWMKLKAYINNNVKKPKQAAGKLTKEMLYMQRHNNCDNEENSEWKNKSFLLKPWFIHWSIMWGFLGLLLATTLDFIFKDPATNIWLPSRILGTAAGILLVYGTSLALYYRKIKISKAYSETRLADWLFLAFLWLAGVTGFWIEFAVTFNIINTLNHLVLIFHIIISMELVLLFAFSKFAHAIYRPLALFIYFNNQK